MVPIGFVFAVDAHEGVVLGPGRHQTVPPMKTVFSGKATPVGQGLCVDPTEEDILVPLAPHQRDAGLGTHRHRNHPAVGCASFTWFRKSDSNSRYSALILSRRFPHWMVLSGSAV